MSKKGMDLQFVVVFIIAMVVLLALGYMLYTRMGMANNNIYSCSSKGGHCLVRASDCTGQIQNFECPGSQPICCVNY